jgi:SWI/SNF-related matrix-associated actin-dependent regulator of chromatin subfamily A3
LSALLLAHAHPPPAPPFCSPRRRSYATLVSDFSGGGGRRAGAAAPARRGPSPLHAISWHRLVLDEGHNCKSPAAAQTRACAALDAPRRWVCTGTPVGADVSDLLGQFQVLGLPPFSLAAFFARHVRNAVGANAPHHGRCPELLFVLRATMVRHTKRQVLGGEEILRLPPKTEERVAVTLRAPERAAYADAHARAAALFARCAAAGPGFVSKHLLQIMALLLPLRRLCSGGALAPADLLAGDAQLEGALAAAAARAEESRAARAAGAWGGAAGGAAAAAAARAAPADASLVAPAADECSICLDVFEAPAVTPCGHWFCRECILGAVGVAPRCPLCRGALAPAALRAGVTAAEAAAAAAAVPGSPDEPRGARVAPDEAAEGDADAPADAAAGAAAGDAGAAAAATALEAAAAAAGGIVADSKLRALVRELRRMRAADPTAKALVFSQYASTISWLQARLPAAGFGHRSISGSMPLNQRARSIAAFAADPPGTVFLLSMRSGAVVRFLFLLLYLSICLFIALLVAFIYRAVRRLHRCIYPIPT